MHQPAIKQYTVYFVVAAFETEPLSITVEIKKTKKISQGIYIFTFLFFFFVVFQIKGLP